MSIKCLEAIIKIKTRYSSYALQKRLLSFILIVAFLFCLLLIRLCYLQIIGQKNLQIKAIEQWVRTLPLTAKRGQIVDTNGNILAISSTTYDCYVRAKEIKEPTKVASYLSSILSLDYENIYLKCRNVYISESLVKLQLDENTAKKIVEKNYDGVYLAENIQRFYPYGNTLSQVLGYLTSDSVGQSGVESYYEDILKGTDGKYLVQSDVRGVKLDDSLNYYIEQQDGLNIKLNIDINIQIILESTLQQIIADHNPKSASIVMIDPNNSKILGLAISPSFDPNEPPRYDTSTLMAQSKNTCVTDVYEPGSTFKILTLASALSENLTNINEHFYCPGYRIVDGEKIKCWRTLGHGDQTLVEAVQNSCNCCFIDLGLRLGKDKLYQYLTQFGIGSKTGVDIAGESGGILLDKSLVQNVDLARIAFGQTVATSQLQLLNAFCSAINGGTKYQPSLLSSYFSSDGTEYYSTTPLVRGKTISSEVSNTIKYLLSQALSKAGEMTFVPGYNLAGKTGTAQKYGSDGKISRGKYVSSFFGFLNRENPEYALLLCVDEPSNGAYYGSVVAKPYAKTIYEKIIAYKNLPPDDNSKLDEKRIIVPNFVGEPISQAIVNLEKLGLEYEIDGEGENVVDQFPSSNTEVSLSTTILLKT